MPRAHRGCVLTEPEPLRVAVLLSGAGSNFAALLAAQSRKQLPVQFTGVYSDRADAHGLALARMAGLRARVIERAAFASKASFEDALWSEALVGDPELIVLAGFMRVLSKASVERLAGRMLNLHPSLLPEFPGLDTHARVLAAGHTEHGASVHFVTEQLDGGPVLAQVRVPVLADDTAQTLAARLKPLEHALLVAAVALIATRKVHIQRARISLDGIALVRPLVLDHAQKLINLPAAGRN